MAATSRFSIEAIFRGVDRITAPVSRMQNNVSRFTRSMERGLRRVDTLGSGLAKGLAKGAGIAAAGLSAAGAVTIAAVNSYTQGADKLAKESRRLDFDIEKLQQWQFVMEQGGVSATELSANLSQMTKRMGEARTGSGTMYTELKRMNPALLKQLQTTKSIPDAMELVIDSMRDLKDPMKQAALANAVFGRSGLKMVDITKMSKAQIADLQHQMRRNGLITMEAAEAAEVYNDTVDSMQRALTGLQYKALEPLVPMLTELADKTREWVLANGPFVTGKLKAGFTWLVENFSKIVDVLKKIGAGLLVFYTAMGVLKAFIAVMTAVNIVMAMNPIGLIVLGVLALTAAVAAAIYYWDEIKASIVAVWEWFGELSVGAKILIAAFTGPLGAIAMVASTVSNNWEGIVATIRSVVDRVVGFFRDIMASPTVQKILNFNPFASMTEGLTDLIETAANFDLGAQLDRLGNWLGMGDDPADGQMVTPQARNARTIEETRINSTAELLIRDETGRAELKNKRGRSANTRLQTMNSGAY